ncbi:MAG: flagellar biosynthetic protein FliO [Firmicutes bacterium]|nr:flagellar biosynthetic protein FliO [Bacillota bacterium]
MLTIPTIQPTIKPSILPTIRQTILLTAQASGPDAAPGWTRPSGAGQFLDAVWVVLAFVIVLAMAYFFTKRFARAKAGSWGRGKANLRLVESCGVGMQSYVHLLRAGKKYMLIGVAKSGVSFLAEIGPEDLESAPEIPAGVLPFEKILKQYFPRAKTGTKGGGDG